MDGKNAVLCLTGFLICLGASIGAEQPPGRAVSETLIAEIDTSSWRQDSVTVSPDSRHVAYVAHLGKRWFMVVDGKRRRHYDNIRERFLTFSPDSKRVAYVGGVGKKWFVVVDREEGKQYDDIGGLIFSPDSKRVAYVARAGKRRCVVVDGKEGRQYDDIGGLTFSPDSKRVVYDAQIGKKRCVVVDGEEGKQYDHTAARSMIHLLLHEEGVWEYDDTLLRAPIFSPDSKHVGYGARVGKKWFAVVDGKEGKQYDGVAGLIFSPDGNRVAYEALVGKKRLVVMDGEEGKQYDMVDTRPLIFSPDGKHVASVGGGGEGQFVVVDGAEGKRYYDIGGLIFSPDSKRLAYPAGVAKNWGGIGGTLYQLFALGSRPDERQFVVVDGAEGKQYRRIGGLIFSPDSKHVAYVAQADKKWLVVVDGDEGKQYDDIGGLIFSPDSKASWTFTEILNERRIGGLIFSPDNKHVAYVAQAGKKWLVVVDGDEGKQYDGIIEGNPISSPVTFDSPDALHYLALTYPGRGAQVYLVQETIQSPDQDHTAAILPAQAPTSTP